MVLGVASNFSSLLMYLHVQNLLFLHSFTKFTTSFSCLGVIKYFPPSSPYLRPQLWYLVMAIPFAPAVDTLVTAFLTGLSLWGLLPSMVFTSFWMSSHFIFCFFLMYSSFQNKSPSHNKQNRFVAYAGFDVSGVPCLPSLLWPKAIGMHTDGGLHHGALSPWGWLLIPEQPCVPTWA